MSAPYPPAGSQTEFAKQHLSFQYRWCSGATKNRTWDLILIRDAL
jgi:hypothetical protein